MLETNEERFKVLFWKYQNLIIQVALNRTEDLFCAQDICQETFLKLYSYRDRIEEEKAKGWMLVVSYNKTCDWLRRNKKYYEIVEKKMYSGKADVTNRSVKMMLNFQKHFVYGYLAAVILTKSSEKISGPGFLII